MSITGYTEQQNAWLSANEIRLGSRVQPYRMPTTGEGGWTVDVLNDMGPLVGQVGEVLEISPFYGLRIYFAAANISRWFPWFVLASADKDALPKTPSEYVKAERDWVAQGNVKKGSTVHVMRAAESQEGGWLCSWTREMDKLVGRNLLVDSDPSGEPEAFGIRVLVDACTPTERTYWMPYFVLRPCSVLRTNTAPTTPTTRVVKQKQKPKPQEEGVQNMKIVRIIRRQTVGIAATSPGDLQPIMKVTEKTLVGPIEVDARSNNGALARVAADNAKVLDGIPADELAASIVDAPVAN